MLPGAFANVDIPLERIENALMVPTQALIPDLKSYKLFVYEGGKAAVRTVQAGARTEQSVQILEGLKPGDTLITSGLLQIRPGMAVQISELQNGQVQMSLSNVSIHRPVLAIVMSLAIVIFGFIGLALARYP